MASTQAQNKLVANALSMGFGGQKVLKNVSFALQDGEFLSILGPSGCGKTTLLRILIGLLPPQEGTVFKDGVNITNFHPSKRGMGIVFQNYALFQNMTALENVAYALKVDKKTRSTALQVAKDMLVSVGLKEHLQKMPGKLSGGQQQRVALARTLAKNPQIILLDEPMSALDVETRLKLRQELKKIQSTFKASMIYVTHDQEEAFAMSQRIMVMENGGIAQLDTPENIIKNPANAYVQNFVVKNLQIKAQSLFRYVQ